MGLDMSDSSGVSASKIGANAAYIRARRDLDQVVVAGLAGISESYLSRLESGQRGWTTRGLIENVAQALSCSVADLTGQPCLAFDRETAAAAAAIPEIAAALYDSTMTDVADQPARPVEQLAAEASRALAYSDDVQLHLAGRGLGQVIAELHVHAVNGAGDDRRAALAALVEACIAVRALAGTIGSNELAVAAARRGYDAARILERPDLIGMMAMGRTMTLGHIGARRRALTVASKALAELPTGPVGKDNRAVQARGMVHLSAALISTRAGLSGDGQIHLAEARALAQHVGEQNHLRFHFGPANVEAWALSLAVELESGPVAAERFHAAKVDMAALHSRDREASVHLDLARAWAQDDSHQRDDAIVLAVDRADRIAPIRVRTDPIAKDLVLGARRRRRVRMWELDSLCNRLGVA
jgi:transcriptional regulator with XRE-family HTH domain